MGCVHVHYPSSLSVLVIHGWHPQIKRYPSFFPWMTLLSMDKILSFMIVSSFFTFFQKAWVQKPSIFALSQTLLEILQRKAKHDQNSFSWMYIYLLLFEYKYYSLLLSIAHLANYMSWLCLIFQWKIDHSLDKVYLYLNIQFEILLLSMFHQLQW